MKHVVFSSLFFILFVHSTYIWAYYHASTWMFMFELIFTINEYTIAQSICTHYSSLSSRPDIFLGCGTLKNQVQNMGLKKQGAKNRAIVIQNPKRQPDLFSFWTTMTLFFLHPAFSGPYFGPDFFQGHKPTHVFKTRIEGADWLGEYCVEHF